MTTPFKGSGSRAGVGAAPAGPPPPPATTATNPQQQAVIDAGGSIGSPSQITYTPPDRSGQDSTPYADVPGSYGGAVPVPAPVPTPTPEPSATPAQRDAYALLLQTLAGYGLESLAPTVQTWLTQGLSEAEILQRMRQTPEFKQRFPAIEAREKAGLSPLSPGEYVAYEQNARQLMRAAGLPTGFYDSNDDFTRFLTNDLSLAELGDRVTLATNAAYQMTAQERQALARFGVTSPGDLTAVWLDPDKAVPLLERKFAAAQLAGTAETTGFGMLSEDEATGLVQQGVSRDAARQGFGQIADSAELFTPLDSGEDAIGRDDQLGATFAGDARARRRIEQRARRRAATFQSGGSFAASQQGLVGLGDTQ